MDPNQALQHAAAVCREAVRLGIADQETLRQLYQEYSGFLQRGVQGSFAQLLLSRKLIDQHGYAQLNRAVTGSSGSDPQLPLLTSRTSGVVQLGTSGFTPPLSGALSRQALAAGLPGPPLPGPPMPGRPMPGPPLPGPPLADPPTDPYGRVLTPPRAPQAPAPQPDLLIPQGLDLSAEEEDGGLDLVIPDKLDFKEEAPLQLSVGTPPSGPSNPGLTFDVLDPAEIGSTADSNSNEPAIPDPSAAFYASSGDSLPGSGQSGSGQPDPEPEAEQEPPKVGDVIDGYQLTGMIGRGGMGVIYKARKQGSQDDYALKVLLGVQDAGADRRRQRFRREVEAMRRLDHENIVGVHDYGRHGLFDWYTMDLVEGKDFEKLLEENALEPAEKMRVYEDICAAMAHAHERSVIHRDLKPQNVLVDERTKRGHVLDFGLAKILDQGVGMTRTGSALGTPFYMAPEQLKSAKHIDARADVFSLGVILYEITTGTRPFLGQTAAEVGNKILTIEPPPPSKLKPDLHPDIDAMVVKALDKDPDHRYPDAQALYADLVKHRKGLGVEKASKLRELQKFAEKNKTALIAVASTAAVMSVVLIAVIGYLRPDKKRPRKVAQKTEVVDKSQGDDDDEKTEEKSGKKTEKTAKKTEKQPSKDPSPRPTASQTPRPSSSPSPRPSREPSPSPSGQPSSSPSPSPSVEPTPARARTPIELARDALTAPRESETPGCEGVKRDNDPKALRELVLALEAGLLPAMATGDLHHAERALTELKSNPRFQLAGLKDEVEHDIDTLLKLRALVGKLVEDKADRLKNLQLYGGERLPAAQRPEVLRGGYVKLGLQGQGDHWLVLDPCALDVKTLRELVVDKSQESASARYALAVLAIYRGANERDVDQDLTEALRTTDQLRDQSTNAVKRRRALAAWLSQTRLDTWRALEDEAADQWRELDKVRKQPAAHLKKLELFVEDYGRTEAYLDRRKDLIGHLTDHRGLEDLLEGKTRSGGSQVRWQFKSGDEARDFEVYPFDDKGDDPRPFRAEAQARGLFLENARLSLELHDLQSDEGALKLSSQGSSLINVFHSGVTQALDPNAGWKILWKDRPLKNVGDTRARKFEKEKEVIFKRGEKDGTRDFMLRFPQEKLSVPLKEFDRPPRDVFLGVEAQGDLRVSEIELEWRKKEQKGQQELLRKALVTRRQLAVEARYGLEHGFVLARDQPELLTGFLLTGKWEAGRSELRARAESELWTLQFAEYGVLRFKLALSDGPGARLLMRDSAVRSGGNGPQWRLPQLQNADPDRYREVTCYFDLPARAATVVVDGVRLETIIDKVPPKAYFGLELLGRTEAKLKELSLVQFRPRKGL
ncbi:MAG: serine/threonine-protein kinase [Planctomycetota bacterium]